MYTVSESGKIQSRNSKSLQSNPALALVTVGLVGLVIDHIERILEASYHKNILAQ